MIICDKMTIDVMTANIICCSSHPSQLYLFKILFISKGSSYMTIQGEHTYTEIMSQPVVWKAAINSFQQQAAAVEALWKQHSFNPILFTGCGSTYYLSQLAATLFQRYLQQPAKAYPGSEL